MSMFDLLLRSPAAAASPLQGLTAAPEAFNPMHLLRLPSPAPAQSLLSSLPSGVPAAAPTGNLNLSAPRIPMTATAGLASSPVGAAANLAVPTMSATTGAAPTPAGVAANLAMPPPAPARPVTIPPLPRTPFQAIQHAEGTSSAYATAHGFASPYDVPLGYGRYGLPSKPLTQMSMGEAYDYGRQILRHPANKLNSSALGAYQITGRTMKDFLPRAGLDWDAPFSPENQDRLAYEIWKSQGTNAWAGFKGRPVLRRVAQQGFKDLPEDYTQWGAPPVGPTPSVPALTEPEVTSPPPTTRPPATTAYGAPQYYRLRSGENPWAVSQRYHIPLTDLMQLNRLNELRAKHLPVGYRLQLPQ